MGRADSNFLETRLRLTGFLGANGWNEVEDFDGESFEGC